jgi:predicted MPP superfamily phosphohydrolase
MNTMAHHEAENGTHSLFRRSETSIKETIRLAAVGDLHCPKTSEEVLGALFSYANNEADILLLCGDLTDYGKPEEAATLAKLLVNVTIPMLGVLGNHDFESKKYVGFSVRPGSQSWTVTLASILKLDS